MTSVALENEKKKNSQPLPLLLLLFSFTKQLVRRCGLREMDRGRRGPRRAHSLLRLRRGAEEAVRLDQRTDFAR